jgi:hypothetical protein
MLDTAIGENHWNSMSGSSPTSSPSFSKFKLKVDTTVDWGLENRSSTSTLIWDPAQPGSSPTSEASHWRGPRKLYGDFLSDSESGRYDMSWGSWEAFLAFLAQEEASKSIEL